MISCFHLPKTYQDYALGNIPSVFYVENADMNGDGIITITDVSIIVNIVLGGSVK
ncbi:MAG: hypothetical protein IKH88_04265 [Prevotella sp.]|nr:hypothetical protein [Prevotella sp.]